MSRELHIGVDARPLTSPHNGVGRYTANLLREFALQPTSLQVFLYSHRPFELGFTLPAHWKICTGNVQSGGLSTAFAQLFFPIWAMRDGINVFWSPRHQLPVLLPPHIRKVVTIHDTVWKRFPETMKRGGPFVEGLLTPLSLQIAARIIADSQFTQSELKDLYPRFKSKIDVIYLASSLTADELTNGSPLSKPYFLFVGSNEPRKNLERMMRAYLQYHKASSSPSDLIIVGTDQWGGFNIRGFIEDNDLKSSVHVIGKADDSTLRTLYSNAQAVLLVSLYEGFGLPLVEAMQWGIPLIASNTSSVAEIAGDAGLLVDPLDQDGIANAFSQMSESDATRFDLSRKSMARGALFSWQKAAAETMAAITGEPAIAECADDEEL
jgi:glycosyltransferase involved in cell wall biosynthesis